MTTRNVPETSGRGTIFATTHWSVVLAASETGDISARHALESLCRTYWYPVYVYIRRRDHDAGEAEDLTQEFFFRLVGKNYLAQVDLRYS